MQRKKRKLWGQHFLRNSRVLQKILVRVNPQSDNLISEIGAGKGVLTFPLAIKVGKVIAIEKDRRLIPLLQKKNLSNLIILEKDVLKIHFRKIIPSDIIGKGQVKLVGNLPYSISSPSKMRAFS